MADLPDVLVVAFPDPQVILAPDDVSDVTVVSYPSPSAIIVGDAGGSTTTYVNKVWDSGGPRWVLWSTTSAPDPTGALYPDPYGTGFGACTGYRIEWIRVE